jgi:hypothetical protein
MSWFKKTDTEKELTKLKAERLMQSLRTKKLERNEKKANNERDRVIKFFANKHKNMLLKNYKFKILERFFQKDVITVNMALVNGNHDTFIVRQKQGKFKYKGNVYIIDERMRYWNVTLKSWVLDYHEACSIPIRRHFDVDELKEAVSQSDIKNVAQAINPSSVQQFIDSTVIEKVMAGEKIDRAIRTLTLCTVATLVVVLAHAAVYVHQSGLI